MDAAPVSGSGILKILLFGKNGQIGWELQRSLAPLGELVVLDKNSTEHCGDFSHPEKIRRTIQAIRPSVIVNAAGYTAVDDAEREPELARLVNATVPAVLAEEALRHQALMVHYSTDYVFDGNGTQPWQETDIPAPLNTYGITKLEGENTILASGCRHLIFRTSWVYSAHGINFARTILRLACEREQLHVVADQFGAPTGAELIADVTAHAIRIRENDTNAAMDGIYHLATSGETSWHGYANFIIDNARQMGMATDIEANAILPTMSSDFLSTAKRPLNSRLNTNKLRNTFNIHLPPWQTGVTRMLAEIAKLRHE